MGKVVQCRWRQIPQNDVLSVLSRHLESAHNGTGAKLVQKLKNLLVGTFVR